jgi:uncharacterized protein YodC (DUF2158 family)
MGSISSSVTQHHNQSSNHGFACRDRVRTLDGTSEMTVILAVGDRVHCEWMVGTELQQRSFPASQLRPVERHGG